MSDKLRVTILMSDSYDTQSLSNLARTFDERGHDVVTVQLESEPQPESLLDCDVFIDRSPCIDEDFYRKLALGYFNKRADSSMNAPIMVDNPFAIMTSFDKRKTHAMFPELVPESYNLDGISNDELIGNFEDDEFVVIKDPFGWYGKGIDRTSPSEAASRYRDASGLVVQKYVPFIEGLGRIYTLNHDSNFQILSSYMETPDIWRSGEGATSVYRTVEVDEQLYLFARFISKTCGLYLNAIDYVPTPQGNVLLEINAVPNLEAPRTNAGADSYNIFADHVEFSAATKRFYQ